MAKRIVRRPEPEPLDLDRPDPEDLGSAGNWLAQHATTLIITFDPTTDTVRVDRGSTPLTIAQAILRKAEAEDMRPETWGDPPEDDEE